MITDGYAFEQETSYIQQKQITNIEPHFLFTNENDSMAMATSKFLYVENGHPGELENLQQSNTI